MGSKKKRQKQYFKKKSIKLDRKWIIIAAVALLVAIAATVITVVLVKRANEGSTAGWQEIKPEGIDSAIADMFIFNYDVGEDDNVKELAELYGSTLKYAYAIFDANGLPDDDTLDASVIGLSSLNLSAGVPISVSPELYSALDLMRADSSRTLFLGPLHEIYREVFTSHNPSLAASIDPMKNAEKARFCSEIASFAAGDQGIRYDLTQDNTVVLHIDAAYHDMLDSVGTRNYLDFGWMRDAFIVDTVAESLASAGYTNGTVASYSGFTRNVSTDSEQDYSFGLYDLYRNNVYCAASISYKGAISTVTYKAFSMNANDKKLVYEYSNGDVTHGYLNATDGMPLAACDMMLFHSAEKSCAEIAVETAELYITETEDKDRIEQLQSYGIGAVWCDGTTINYTSDDISIYDLFSSDSLKIYYNTVK